MNEFDEMETSSIGVEIINHDFKVDGQDILVEMWDTVGQEKFHSITSTYYRGADAILLMFCMDNEQSFNKIPEWMDDALKFSSESVTVGLFANKCDIGDDKFVVTKDDCEQFANLNQIPLFYVSAKSGENCTEGVEVVIKRILEKRAAREAERLRREKMTRR